MWLSDETGVLVGSSGELFSFYLHRIFWEIRYKYLELLGWSGLAWECRRPLDIDICGRVPREPLSILVHLVVLKQFPNFCASGCRTVGDMSESLLAVQRRAGSKYCSSGSGMTYIALSTGCLIIGTVVASVSSTNCCLGRILSTCLSQ